MATEPESEKFSYKPGVTVGEDYVLQEFLGKGGMGVVFRASHRFIKQDYAIKLLPLDLLTEENWLRFQREAQALAKLNHPGIVRIFNMGIDRQRCPYYVMELLTGISLADALKERGPMPQPDALACFLKVASALEAAHKQHIIHRDVKPANIMLLAPNEQAVTQASQGPSVKLVDFGLARVIENKMMEQSLVRVKEEQNLTRTGNVFGSPLYMSPEQCRGELLDVRSDIYSFGCSIFEALTGLVPFHGQTPLETFMMHESKSPPKLSEMSPLSTFSDDLENAVARMLAKRKEDRYQNMDSLIHDLERISVGKPIAIQSQSDETYKNTAALLQPESASQTQKDRRKKWLAPALFALALLLIAGTAFGAYNYFRSSAKSFLRVAEPEGSAAKPSTDNTAVTGNKTYNKHKIESINQGPNRQEKGRPTSTALEMPTTSKSKSKDPLTIHPPSIKREKVGPNTIVLTFPKGSENMSYYKNSRSRETLVDEMNRLNLVVPALIGFSLTDFHISELKIFEDEDISGMKVEDLASAEQFEQILDIARPWKRLVYLLFRQGSLQSADLSALDRLPHLNELELVECKTNMKSVANLNCLTNLRIFAMVNLYEQTPAREAPHIARMLERLAQNKRISILNLKGQPISHKTMLRLLKTPSLKTLIIFGYKWNEDSLQTLKRESNIHYLRVREEDIPEKLIPLLAGSKCLTSLAIDDVSNRQSQVRLMALRPFLVNADQRKINLEVSLKPGIDY
ncbi:MAG: serine/threonine protein kinase [Candidatus Melainabacteria bacterium]|nr:serine/threonine protein kinase [Candidatus Melainabacteria bacterium]